jgi:hypothetical protein
MINARSIGAGFAVRRPHAAARTASDAAWARTSTRCGHGPPPWPPRLGDDRPAAAARASRGVRRPVGGSVRDRREGRAARRGGRRADAAWRRRGQGRAAHGTPRRARAGPPSDAASWERRRAGHSLPATRAPPPPAETLLADVCARQVLPTAGPDPAPAARPAPRPVQPPANSFNVCSTYRSGRRLQVPGVNRRAAGQSCQPADRMPL